MKQTLFLSVLLVCCALFSVYAAVPTGWYAAGSAVADYDMGSQPGQRHPDDFNAYIRARKASSGFGTLMQTISAGSYHGKRVRFSGYLKTSDAGKAGLWMRIDGSERRVLGFDNMQKRALHGNHDWQRYTIVLDVPTDATDIAYGFLLDGKGEVLADDFTLETVGLDVPTTGGIPHAQLPAAPVNMRFRP